MDVADGGGVLNRLKKSLRQTRKNDGKDFQYVSHRNNASPNRSSDRPKLVRKIETSTVPFRDEYEMPLDHDDMISRSGYVTDIPKQNINGVRSPFYTPAATKQWNENNNSSSKETDHLRKAVLSVQHRRSRSDQLVRLPNLQLNVEKSKMPVKYGTIHSPITQRPVPTSSVSQVLYNSPNVPVTPGINENPLSFRLREQEKTDAFANRQKFPSDRTLEEQSFEYLMYGNSALKDDFVRSQELDKSTTDWEGIKRQLKSEQKELTKRLSQRLSVDYTLDVKLVGGLDLDTHLYYKPNATREDTAKFLKDASEGMFIVRQSRKSHSYALSLSTIELGIQHILIQEHNRKWKISSGSQSQIVLPLFDSIPQLVDYYKRNKLPIKGCQREIFLK